MIKPSKPITPGDSVRAAALRGALGHPHSAGIVLPDQGDGLHWLRCVDCGREWAEKDSGVFARGAKFCSAIREANER